jgi:hypothetical protein
MMLVCKAACMCPGRGAAEAGITLVGRGAHMVAWKAQRQKQANQQSKLDCSVV